MLLGCWMLNDALQLEAGQLRGLLVLMLVLQLYEGLLAGLGAYRTGRAAHDGIVVSPYKTASGATSRPRSTCAWSPSTS
jgi:hypothetical protein